MGKQTDTPRRPANGGIFSQLASLTLSAASAWVLYSTLMIDHRMPLDDALSARRETLFGTGSGLISYYADREGEGRPLVLLHSINAAASAYEMRPLFEHYRGSRPVYAPDLPGFGFSERSERDYTPALYTQAILHFLQHVVGQPADVVALSLSGEFAALAAIQQPDAFHSLTLISPSGFGPERDRTSSDTLHRVFSFPLWAQALYDLIATRRSIDFFLSQSFEGDVDEGLAAYGYNSAHRPGARHAPLAFISGRLFTPGIRTATYAALTLPALVLYDRDAFVRFDALPDFAAQHTNWSAVRIQPTLGLPQFERPVETCAALDEFWRGM